LAGARQVRALVDTGASLSLLRYDVAQEIFRKRGRPFRLVRSRAHSTTINGVSIEVLGTAEFEVENVGPVRFH
jgi:predicted aspartyl protease